MAIGSMVSAGAYKGACAPMVPSSVKGRWIICNDDLEQTVPAAPLNPAGITDASIHWVKVPDWASKVLLSARMTKAATVTTSPVVRLVGAYPSSIGATLNQPPDPFSFINDNGSFPNDGTIRFMRLDLADSDGTGITLTLTSSGAGMMIDAASTAKAYADPPTITPYDLLGAWYVTMIPVTAANVDTGLVTGELMFLN